MLLATININAQEIFDAIKANDLVKTKELINEDASFVNLKDENWNTPLHWATLNRNNEIVKLLLKNGAITTQINKRGDTPVNYAIGRLPEETITLMLDYVAEFDAIGEKTLNVLQLSARFGLERLFKIAAEKGGPILFSDSSANIETLKSAILGGSLELVKILIEKGVNVNAVSKYRGTPLDVAYETGNKEIIEYLKGRGAMVTPLDFEIKKLSESLLLITFPWGMRNNIIAFGGEDGILIVDAGFSKRATFSIKKVLTKFYKCEVWYLINSHSHWDHIAGNLGLSPNEDSVISLGKIEDRSLTCIITKLDKSMTGNSGLTLPTHYVMKFNNSEISFFPYPQLHSNDDMLIYFPQSKVLYLGDLLLSQSCPAIENVNGYMKFLNIIIDVFPSECIFISGHGRCLTYSELKEYRSDISAMNDIVIKNYKEGKSLEEILANNILGNYKCYYSQLDWLGPDNWIRIVYENLESGLLK